MLQIFHLEKVRLFQFYLLFLVWQLIIYNDKEAKAPCKVTSRFSIYVLLHMPFRLLNTNIVFPNRGSSVLIN